MTKILLLGVVLIVFVTGCGSSDGGGTVMFNTVNVTASADSAKNPLLSDLATWSDEANRCNTATATITNDLVNFTIVSTKSIATGTASDIMIQKATIVFSPADTQTPVLPNLLATSIINYVGLRVTAGSSLSVPIEVVPHNLKLNFDPCAIPYTYNYNVQVLFDVVEAATGKSGTIPAGMTVRIADFAD